MHVGVDAPKPDADALGGHWQSNMVVPHRSALDGSRLSDDVAEELREIGFTAVAIAPRDGVLRGSAAVVAPACQSAKRSTASAAASISHLSSGGKRRAWQGCCGSERRSIRSHAAGSPLPRASWLTSLKAERELVTIRPRVASGWASA